MNNALSGVAEETLLDLNATARSWAQQRSSPDQALIAICATLEAYVDAWVERVIVIVTADDAFRSSFANYLIDSHIETASSNWSSRTESIKELTGVVLRSFDRWQIIDGTIQARNAIVHGLGSLTRVQRRKPLATLRRLMAAGFDVDAGVVTHGEDAILRSVNASVAFVRWADGEFFIWESSLS
jgi:hypothetical protein